MQYLPFLDAIPLWGIYLLTVGLFMLVVEGGYRVSQVMQHRSPDKAESGVGTMAAAMLALLGFLLAFVSSTALNISIGRRDLVTAEANAIGTTYLRAGYLPPAMSESARDLLREYLDSRLVALDREQTLAAITRSEEIQGELWAQAEQLAIDAPTPVTSLYISSLNDVIDLHTLRINQTFVYGVPNMIIIGLYLIGMLTLAMVGLHAGYSERRNLVAIFALILILATVYLLIFDLDRGQSGMVRVPQQALFDLQRQIGSP